MDKSNAAVMGYKERQWPDSNSLLPIRGEARVPIALGLLGLGFLTLFVVCLFTWRDPSINWGDIASQVMLYISDI
jgi:hypothetical protein